MIDWQPIETAPRDGATVLLWIPREGDCACCLPARAESAKWDRGAWDMLLDEAPDPTHWAPLNIPEAP